MIRNLQPWRAFTAPVRRLIRQERGATMLEFTLLLAAIALPSFAVTMLALQVLTGHYRIQITLNALPLP